MADCQAAAHPVTGTVQVIGPDASAELLAAWAQDMCQRAATMHLGTECACGCVTSWVVCWPCAVAIIRQLRSTRKPARCVRCSVADIPGGRPHTCPVTLTLEGDPVPVPVTT